MGDYGLKIAKHAHDISEEDRYMLFTSKYTALKLAVSGEGTLSYVGGVSSGIVEITHNLGYVPICFVYGQYFDTTGEAVVERYSRWSRWIYQGLQVADTYYYYADTAKLYIVFSACYLTNAYSFDLDYMYHIFYDEDTT